MEEVTMVKVFSETKHRERQAMGEQITLWLLEHKELKIVDKVVTQSSDNAFHCFTITLFLAKR